MSASTPGHGIGRRLGAPLLLLVGSGLLTFAVLELGIRALQALERPAPSDGPSWAVHDADLGYRPRPGFADHNAHGLRDDPITEKSRFRILMLGDSVTAYGDDPQDTYPGHLERELDANPAVAPLEVINAGVRGYTNHQELAYLRKFGLELEPDLVGVGFVLNDLHRILHRFEIVDGQIVGEHYAFADEAIDSVESPLYRLARSSRLLVWLRARLGIFDRLIELYARDGFVFDYRPDFSNAWEASAWPDVRDQLAQMVRLGEANGFRVFLVAFPFAEQLRADYLERDRDYVTFPQRQLGEACRALGIPFLDLFGKLDAERHFLPDRIHLTAEGRAVAGREIASFLHQRGLVPSAADPAPGRAAQRLPGTLR